MHPSPWSQGHLLMGLAREGGQKQVAYIPSEFMFMLVDVKAVRTERLEYRRGAGPWILTQNP